MTREENLLFCKIAIHNSLVTADDANAILRRAVAEEGDVGQLLVEAGILDADQAAKITQAVMRRAAQARAPAPAAAAPAAAQGGGRARSAYLPRGRRGASRRQQLSTNQLLVTGGSILVIIIVCVVLFVLWRQDDTPRHRAPDRTTPTGETQPPAAGGAQMLPDTGLPPAVAGDPGTGPVPPPLSAEEEQAVLQAYTNAQMDGAQALVSTPVQMRGALSTIGNALRQYGERFTADQRAELERLKGLLEKRLEASG